MKKLNSFMLIMLFVLTFNLVGAVDANTKSQACDPTITLLSQDPYSAVPGEYVKLVFKVDGLAAIECKDLTFKLLDEYPIRFDPGADNTYSISSGNYLNDFGSSVLIPFKVRVDENALDGDNEIKLLYSDSRNINSANVIKKVNLSVQNVDAAFEISVKDYDMAKQILTFEIINIGKNDVNALTIDLTRQDNFNTKGSVRDIIGSLNSGDDTSFTFEGVPKDGAVTLKISYNDVNNVRRSMDKNVQFNSDLFKDRVKDKKSSPVGTYVALLIIIVAVVYFFYSRNKKKKKMKEMQLQAMRRK